MAMLVGIVLISGGVRRSRVQCVITSRHAGDKNDSRSTASRDRGGGGGGGGTCFCFDHVPLTTWENAVKQGASMLRTPARLFTVRAGLGSKLSMRPPSRAAPIRGALKG